MRGRVGGAVSALISGAISALAGLLAWVMFRGTRAAVVGVDEALVETADST